MRTRYTGGKCIDSITIKLHNFIRIKSIIVTKLETSSSQNKSQIAYKIYTGSDGNLRPLNAFKILFPKEIIKQLAKHKNKSSVL